MSAPAPSWCPSVAGTCPCSTRPARWPSTWLAARVPQCSMCRTWGLCGCRAPRAHRSLQWALTNDLDRVGVGSAQYTHLLDPSDASVLDDIIVWWIGPEHFDVMPNASNTDRVVSALQEGSGDLDVADVTADRAVIAVQGPEARARIADAGGADVAAVGRFKVAAGRFGDIQVTVAGTGYTGEDGVEVAVGVEDAPTVWQRLHDAGVSAGWAGGPRHPAPGGWSAAARARVGSRHHASSGRTGLGRSLGQGRLQGPGSVGGRTRRRAEPAASGPAGGQGTAAPRRLRGPSRRR